MLLVGAHPLVRLAGWIESKEAALPLRNRFAVARNHVSHRRQSVDRHSQLGYDYPIAGTIGIISAWLHEVRSADGLIVIRDDGSPWASEKEMQTR